MTTIDLDPDAPHSPDRTRELADTAAAVARTLNYATMPGRGGLVEPGDVYELLGALAQFAERIPQLCGQVADFLERERDAGHFKGIAEGPRAVPPTLMVTHATDALTSASGYAEGLRDMFRNAQAAMRSIRYVGPTERSEQIADVTHYAHAMTGEGADTPRCGAAGRVALFAYDVTCPQCLALLAAERGEQQATEAAAADPVLHWHSRGLRTTTLCQGEPLTADDIAPRMMDVTCPACVARLDDGLATEEDPWTAWQSDEQRAAADPDDDYDYGGEG